MNYNLLKTFIKVAELGSFTRAATVLNQPKSRVSRAITRLENELGVQLLRRTTRSSSLTPAGQNFYQKVFGLMESIDSEITKVSNLEHSMSGLIRVTASQDIGQTLLATIISEFSKKYPDVYFETYITNDLLDLAKENIDIAFRAGRLKDSSMKQKKLLKASFMLLCSPGYISLYGKPETMDDLSKHRFLSFRGMESTFFKIKSELKPILVSDSIPMLLKMAMNGDGITILPDFFCADQISARTLVRLIPDWKSRSEGIHMVYPPSKTISNRVKLFAEEAIKTVATNFKS